MIKDTEIGYVVKKVRYEKEIKIIEDVELLEISVNTPFTKGKQG